MPSSGISGAPGCTVGSLSSQSPPPSSGEKPSPSRSTARRIACAIGPPSPVYIVAALITAGELPAPSIAATSTTGSASQAARRGQALSFAACSSVRRASRLAGIASTQPSASTIGARSGSTRAVARSCSAHTMEPMIASMPAATNGAHTDDTARARSASAPSGTSSARPSTNAAIAASPIATTVTAIATTTTSPSSCRPVTNGSVARYAMNSSAASDGRPASTIDRPTTVERGSTFCRAR